MHDRGTLTVGKRADINLIDLESLRIAPPEMVFDLPAGGRRLIQKVTGYEATFVKGVQTFHRGEPTGDRPGGLVRA
jgi:N-acyl-D-amino-acid deacylase